MNAIMPRVYKYTSILHISSFFIQSVITCNLCTEFTGDYTLFINLNDFM